MLERVQKVMARAGIGSRRACETLIASGQVTINDRVAKIGDKADPDQDDIKVDGRRLVFENLLYIKLYKPVGVLSSTEDELNQGRTTVIDLVNFDGHLYPVGRLDKQSEGLILLTNDGPLTHQITHPRYRHKKVYKVAVEGRIRPYVLTRWRKGVDLDGRKTATVNIEVTESDTNQTWLRITMREGRKRQIRRLAAQLGHPVTRLIRLEIGPLRLGYLKPGQWKHLSNDEVNSLRESIKPNQVNKDSLSDS